LSEIVLRSTLIELPNTGHLAESGGMLTAISQEVSRHNLLV
jgi:proline iminopeptidase